MKIHLQLHAQLCQFSVFQQDAQGDTHPSSPAIPISNGQLRSEVIAENLHTIHFSNRSSQKSRKRSTRSRRTVKQRHTELRTVWRVPLANEVDSAREKTGSVVA